MGFTNHLKWLYYTGRNIVGKDGDHNISSPNAVKKQLDPLNANEMRANAVLKRDLNLNNSFDVYQNEHKTVNPFASAKADDDESIAKKLFDSETIKKALGLIANPETPDESAKALQTQKTKFEEAFKLLKNLKEHNIHPESVASYMHNLKSETENIIKAQHETELTALKAITDEQWKEIHPALKDDDIGKFKTDRIKDLELHQKAELEKFSTNMDESLKKIHDESERINRMIPFLANQYKNSEEMRKIIKELNKLNKSTNPAPNNNENPEVETSNSDMVSIKGIDIKQLPLLRSITGKKIEQAADGSFHMQMPNRWNLAYYKSASHNTKADLLTLAQAVRACGHDGITMSINNKDEKRAMQLGRDAYEAALDAGFEPNNIKIKVNGVLAKDLFNGHEGRKKAAETQAALANKKSEERQPKTRETYNATQNEMKTAMDTERAKAKVDNSREQQNIQANNNPP